MMKRIFLAFIFSLLIVGCGKQVSTESEFTPQQVSQMSEEQREAEINKILQKVGTQLPSNWREMSKQEQGKFILKYGLGVEVSEEK